MKILDFKINENLYKNIFPYENGREINTYLYLNCCLTGDNLYYPNVLLNDNNEWLILPVIERTMSLKMSSIYEKNNMQFHYDNKNNLNKVKYDLPLFFFIYNTDNYFHYLYDTLPYLISYLNLKRDIPELKLLMNYPNPNKKNFYPFIVEFLSILNINETDIVIADENTLYSKIYISTSYTHDIDSNLPPRKEIYDFYKNMVSEVRKKYNNIETPKKIYVSRRTWLHNNFSNIGTNYTTRRKMVNENELVGKLEKDGYVEIFTENLSTIEKILYFGNATHVVGAIGGGISNVLFSSKDTKLEAIVSPSFLDVNYRFKYSLDCIDVTYNYNTKHVEEGEFKTYMRVKTKDNKIIGEIEKINNNKLLILYANEFNVGWNLNNKYNEIELDIEDVEKLDNGLNSPWKVEL